MSEWIKCSESMPCPPDKSMWVLVYADGSVNCMAYSGGQWKDWTNASAHNIVIGDISHWMPLPSPPEDSQ